MIELELDVPVPLTRGQLMLWCNSLAVPEYARAALNMSRIVPVPCEQSTEGVRAVILALVTRHEALRTTIELDESGDPRQVVHPPTKLSVPELCTNEQDASDFAVRVATDLRREPMRLEIETPLRAAVVTSAGQPQFLCLVVHHIAADARTVDLLMAELTCALAGRPLTGSPRQPREVAVAEAATVERSRAAAALSYWSKHLSTIPTALFPYSCGPAPKERLRVQMNSPALATVLPSAALDLNVPQSAILMAAVTAALLRYTEGTHWFWTTVVDNRPSRGHADSVGSFVQLGMVSVAAESDPDFADLARRCARAQLLAARHSRYDHGAMLAERSRATEQRRTMVTLPTIFNFKPTVLRGKGNVHGVDLIADEPGDTRYTHGPGQGKPDTALFVVVQKLVPEVEISFDFDGSLIAASDAETILRGVEDMLLRVSAGQNLRVSDVAVPIRSPQWLRTGDGRALDLRGTADLIRDLHGVTDAAVEIRDDGSVIAVVDGDIAPEVVHDHLAVSLERPGVALPEHIRVAGRSHAVSFPVSDAWNVLVAALSEKACIADPDPAHSYTAQGGPVVRGPAVIQRLADLGYEGVVFADLLTARPLRSLLADMRPTSVQTGVNS